MVAGGAACDGTGIIYQPTTSPVIDSPADAGVSDARQIPQLDGGSGFLPSDAAVRREDASVDGTPLQCTAGAYPAGPYGARKDSIIRNHTLQGYVNGDTSQVRQWSFDQYYCMGVTGEAKALLISFVSATCSACQAEQTTLLEYYAEAKSLKIEIAEIMWQFSSQQAAQQWVSGRQLQFTFGFDFDVTEMTEFATGSVPINVLVDLKTMKVVWIGGDGLDTGMINQLAGGL
jgi:hypothetical protein